ncbi:hypothetical protein CMUS01_11114 [Colletotrichum musicola]|uniref:F-box domain-containing protein n=1 Tax=Colletotrichum musicola TaxID=2175873 RepID=A0A8H6K098_9PEZI|nr:hypothetical protein CMUS01_11114 [Colletotrichum musicola]
MAAFSGLPDEVLRMVFSLVPTHHIRRAAQIDRRTRFIALELMWTTHRLSLTHDILDTHTDTLNPLCQAWHRRTRMLKLTHNCSSDGQLCELQKLDLEQVASLEVGGPHLQSLSRHTVKLLQHLAATTAIKALTFGPISGEGHRHQLRPWRLQRPPGADHRPDPTMLTPPPEDLHWGKVSHVNIESNHRDEPTPWRLVLVSLARCPTFVSANIHKIRCGDGDPGGDATEPTTPFFPALKTLRTAAYGGAKEASAFLFTKSYLYYHSEVASVRRLFGRTFGLRRSDPSPAGSSVPVGTHELKALTRLVIRLELFQIKASTFPILIHRRLDNSNKVLNSLSQHNHSVTHAAFDFQVASERMDLPINSQSKLTELTVERVFRAPSVAM